MRVDPTIRRIGDYVAATENEISIDEFIFKLVHLEPKTVGFLPRLSKWFKLGRDFPVVTFCAWSFTRYFWLVGGNTVFFFLQFFPRWLGASKVSRVTPGDEGYILALSSRVGDIVKLRHFVDLPNTWVTVPWAPLKQVPSTAICLDVFALLSRRDLWQAFCDAITATYSLFRRKRTSKWVLQSYTAFRWFAVRAAIDKLPGYIVMANHFDRWAVLVDSSVWAQKCAVASSGDFRRRELILIQHGSLGSLGGDKADSTHELRLYRKLRSVTHLYAYGAEAAYAFKNDVLSAGCRQRGLKVSFFKPSIELNADDDSTGLKLLFVGHPLCEPLHRHIFLFLCDRYDFKAYYKPHPTVPMSASMRRLGWVIIDNPSIFPAVDFLISYQSTLVIEYAGAGVPAAVHPINLEAENSIEFIGTLTTKIDALRSHCAARVGSAN